MPSNANKANKASNTTSSMTRLHFLLRCGALVWIVGSLLACSSRPPPKPAQTPPPPAQLAPPTSAQPPSALPFTPTVPTKSRWVRAQWHEIPGLYDDALVDAWDAWLRGCERPSTAFADLCPQVRLLSMGSAQEQRAWLLAHLQPWRIESDDGKAEGLLTAYYEPLFEARRLPDADFHVPLYSPPAGYGPASPKPWYSRQQIETQAQAQAALAGRAIAWLRDPIEALILHIQGSGRLYVTEPDGSARMVRLAFAATNEHPYYSVGRWLLARGLVQDATWPGIHAWAAANPHRLQEMLWSNPRYVFFHEEALDALDLEAGPRGALGVPLTAGRSIAIDPHSIPYGTPVWLSTPGPTAALSRLVFAQDTGSAIVGAVRADYFVGWGPEAGELAGRIKQPLHLWVLWPRHQALPGDQ